MKRREFPLVCLCLASRHGEGLAQRAPEALPVLYPDIGEPYRSVFAKIIEGIEDRLRAPTRHVAVASTTEPQQLAQDLLSSRPRVVIALGRAGLKVAAALDRSVEVVAGGVIAPSEGEQRSATLLSLAPDPALLMQRLKQLQPQARRVSVVHSRSSAWLLRFAREAARGLDLELRALEAEDLKQALRHYQDLLAAGMPGQDALWLPQDAATVDESAVLPLVLQEAWDRGLTVFSSNVGHVRRGVLFSLFPNNLDLGRSLANSAMAFLGGAGSSAPRGAWPLRDVHAALNTRTASHLGLNLSSKLMQGFELLLPER